MARYTGADCRRCRREKMKLFLKGSKCESPKCPIEIRPYPPGQHGRGRTKDTEYLLQMREKQKCARIYGVLEKQFRGYYEEANKKTGKTGENLLVILETRLDNVVYRAGFAHLARPRPPGGPPRPRPGQRQEGRHPVVPRDAERHRRDPAEEPRAHAVRHRPRDRRRPAARRPWMEVISSQMRVLVHNLPARQVIDTPVQEQLIVELYSK